MINTNYNDKLAEMIELRSSQDRDQQIEQAVEAIKEMETIDIDAALKSVNARIDRSERFTRLSARLSRVAAILFVPMLVLAAWALLDTKPNGQTGQTIVSPAGTRSIVDLADGTKVWLNSDSSISFDVPFGRHGREVKVTGEAYFDVTHDTNNPFRVTTSRSRVEVTGTKFNVRDYESEQSATVALESGSVKVCGNDDNYRTMHPDQLATIGNNSLKISAIKAADHTAWHLGKIVFDETPISDVATILSRWFGVEFEITDRQIENYRITATFNNESLYDILDLIKISSPLQVTIQPATIDNNGAIKESTKVVITRKIGQ